MRFLRRIFGRGRKRPSGALAKKRLRLVLAHDRSSVSPGLLATLKDEIIAVISQHVEIDADSVQVSLSHTLNESRLVADIPLVAKGRRRKKQDG